MNDRINGIAANPKDPLWKNAPKRVEYLTKKFGEAAHQFSAQDVVNAAAGIMVTALRQAHGNKREAEARYDEIVGRMKTILLNHYDHSGRLKGVFPYDQTIQAPLIVDKVLRTNP